MFTASLLFASALHVPRLGTFTADGQEQHGFHVSLRQFPSVSPDLHKRVRSLSKGILLGKTYRQDRPERLVVLSSVMPSMAVSAVTKKDEAR